MARILIAGDLCPVGRIEQIVLEKDQRRIAGIFESVHSYVKRSDYVVGNLECPLTRKVVPIEKTGPNLRASPETIVLLKNLGVSLVTLANNHIFDHGLTGLRDTVSVCHDNGIATVGAGETLADAQEPFVTTVSGLRVAFVNFAENEFSNANRSQGGANRLDIIDGTRQIQAARQQADAVIVIIHGGYERFHYPSPRMVKQYRFFAEQGVTAIIGHHPHCVSGYEVHQGVPIFYSLGNFLFDSTTSFPGWYEGYMLDLHITDPRRCQFSVIPYEQCRNGSTVQVLTGEKADQFERNLNMLSAVLGHPHQLEAIWDSFTMRRAHIYLYSLSPVRKRVKQVLWKCGLMRYLLPRRYLLTMLNMLRCESHRDVMLDTLSRWLSVRQPRG